MLLSNPDVNELHYKRKCAHRHSNVVTRYNRGGRTNRQVLKKYKRGIVRKSCWENNQSNLLTQAHLH